MRGIGSLLHLLPILFYIDLTIPPAFKMTFAAIPLDEIFLSNLDSNRVQIGGNDLMANANLKLGFSSLAIGAAIICGCLLLNCRPKCSAIQISKESDEIAGLQQIAPDGWVLKRENDTVTFTMTKACQRDTYQKPNPGPYGNEQIHPSVTVIFEPLWSEERIKENEKCVEQWSKNPAAVSPPCRSIFANTGRYTIFVSGSSCLNENEELLDKLKAYFERQ